MPLVPAICTQCGAQIEVDAKNEAAICPFCGTAHVVERAINNYKVSNNIKANVVNIINQNDTADSLFATCLACCKKGEYNAMEHMLTKYIREYPTDYRVYYIKLLQTTNCFTRFDENIQSNKLIENNANKWFDNILKWAPTDEISEIKVEYNTYISKLRRIITVKQDEEIKLTQKIEKQAREIAISRGVIKGIIIVIILTFVIAIDIMGYKIGLGVLFIYFIAINIPCLKLIKWIIDK